MSIVIDLGLMVAVIIALGEVIKRTELMKVKYLPIVNIILGVIAGVVFIDAPIQESILTGIVVGLSASGLFDLTKAKTKK